MEVGDRLNPQRSYRKGFALKGLCQHIIKTNNPSTIGPGELLTVRFQNDLLLVQRKLLKDLLTKIAFYDFPQTNQKLPSAATKTKLSLFW